MKKYLFLLLLIPTIIFAQNYSVPGKFRADTIYFRGSIRFVPNATITQIDSGMVLRANAAGEFLPSKIKMYDLGTGGSAAADSDFVLKRNGKWESVSVASIPVSSIDATGLTEGEFLIVEGDGISTASIDLDSKLSLSGGSLTGTLSTIGNIILTGSDNLIQSTIHDLYFLAGNGTTEKNFIFGYNANGNYGGDIELYNATTLAVRLGEDGYIDVTGGYKINGAAISLTDTDDQTLTYNSTTKALSISEGNSVTISGFLTAEVDGSTTNEIQSLSYHVSSNTIRLSGDAATIDMSLWADATHSHPTYETSIANIETAIGELQNAINDIYSKIECLDAEINAGCF